MNVTQISLVQALVQAQFPVWADLPVKPIVSTGTDNAIFRLGPSLVVRLPKVEWAAGQPTREHRWLPKLAARLPLETPEPVALGSPGSGYPWRWSVQTWIRGNSANRDDLDNCDAAEKLADFVAATRAISLADGPAAGPDNGYRGVPLALRDASVRRALELLVEEPGVDAAAAVWEDAMLAPPWSREPVWLHGDLQASNLVVRNGCLIGVIDFGMMAVGDPACDLMAAWTCLGARGRDVFLDASEASDADIRRGRGWAVSTALVALAHYRDHNPGMADIARATLAELAGACERDRIR